MHELAPLIKDLAIILGIAGIVAILFQKIRQPVVLGYLAAGMFLGPYTPPYALVSDLPYIKILSELGVIFLMFSLGLEFSFNKLKRVGFSASISGLIEVLGMLLLGLATGILLGWSFLDSLFLGAALSISSTTIIIKAIEELNLKRKHFAEVVFGILIIEDLIAILLLVILSTIVATNSVFSLTLLWSSLKLVLVVGGWFLMGYFMVPSLFRYILPYTNEETLTIASVALCLFLACLASYFGYSTALGAFIMGSILAETTLIHHIEKLIRPIRDVFAAVFFVSVGMLINPFIIFENWTLILLICFITIAGKLITTSLGTFLSGQSINNSLRIGFSMAQIGEFSFIIAGLGLALNATSNFIFPILVAVSAITTFTTPYFIQLSGYLSHKIDSGLSTRVHYFFTGYTAWINRITTNPKQKPIYRRALIRLVLNGVIVAIIFILSENWIFPEIIKYVPSEPLEKVFAWLIAILVSSPFIWGMLRSFSLSSPAIYLSSLVTLLEIAILSSNYFDTWFITILLVLITITFFALLYKQLDKSYYWFEERLLHNLQSDIPETIDEHALPTWGANLTELEVKEVSPLVGQILKQAEVRTQYGINLVAVAHGSTVVLISHQQAPIRSFDRLIVFGNDDKIADFIEEAQLQRL